MKLALVLIIVVVILVITLYFLGRICKSLQEEVNYLNVELAKQKKVCKELRDYTEQLVKINGDKDNVAQKIKEAESDEEVLSIVAGIVNANNNRVRK